MSKWSKRAKRGGMTPNSKRGYLDAVDVAAQWEERALKAEAERDALAAHVAAVPDGVWEALQRLIENAQSLGEASQEDALLVARYRDRHCFMGDETSLARLKAQWQAEAVDTIAAALGVHGLAEAEGLVADLAARLRRQAEETKS